MSNKVLFSICLLLCSMTIASAQVMGGYQSYSNEPVAGASDSKVAVKLGLGGGVTVSGLTTSNSNYSPLGPRVGFNGGLLLNIRFAPRDELSTAAEGLLAIQPEIRFSTMGGNNDDAKLGLNDVTVPVMFQVWPSAKFYIEAGPVACLNISHTPNTTTIGDTQYNLAKLKANDLMLGAGLGFALGNLSVGARFNYGFSDIAANMPWKSWCLQAGLAYSFSLGGKSSRPIDTNPF